jgi:hypothetical protein
MLAASIMTIDSPAAFQWVLQVEPDNALLLAPLQQKTWETPALVIVELAIAFAPRVELANGGYRSRRSEAVGADQSNKAVEFIAARAPPETVTSRKHQTSREAYDGTDEAFLVYP